MPTEHLKQILWLLDKGATCYTILFVILGFINRMSKFSQDDVSVGVVRLWLASLLFAADVIQQVSVCSRMYTSLVLVLCLKMVDCPILIGAELLLKKGRFNMHK